LQGFTLVELLVVITIIVLVSAVTLPTVLPALNHRQVGEAARILQGALVGARDQAIRDNAPRGIRLLPDPVISGVAYNTNGVIVNANGSATTILAYNRFVPITTPGDYTTGRASITLNPNFANPTPYLEAGPAGAGPPNNPHPALRVDEEAVAGGLPGGLPNERTSWFWNIRIGDKIRFNDAGSYYTVVGPMFMANSELFVNDGSTPPMTKGIVQTDAAGNTYNCEYLYVVNGVDDIVPGQQAGDGFVDNGWDGFDNNYNGVIDDYKEWFKTDQNGNLVLDASGKPIQIEDYQWVGTELTRLIASPTLSIHNIQYTMLRRPIPVAGAREVTLPGGVVVDATTGFPGQTQERSRLPIDPKTLYIDILVNSNGQVVPTTEYSTPAASTAFPFFHFWLTERQDVHETTELWGSAANPNSGSGMAFLLPMPAQAYAQVNAQGAQLLSPPPTLSLRGERTLLTLFTRTGLITSNTLDQFVNPASNAYSGFDLTNTTAPFYQAQSGTREAK
jgi:prepilin-type N-terminal cleavage/methylation domain-containing protein